MVQRGIAVRTNEPARAEGPSARDPRERFRSDDADRYLRQLSAEAKKRLPQLCDTVTGEILHQMRVYGGGSAVVRTELERSVESNLGTMIEALCAADRSAIDLTWARDTGSRRARQGVPLPEVLRAFRIGFSSLWDVLVDIAAESGETELRTLIAAANTFWYLIDEYLEAVTEAYRGSTAELVREQRQRRGALLEALFSGGVAIESALWDVTQLLGLPFDGTFVVVAAESGELASAALPGIERVLAERGLASAWRLTPSYELGIVSVHAADRVGELVDVLTDQFDVRVGISPTYTGLENTPRALHLAHVARASIPAGQTRAACFDESPLSMLVAAAPEESVSIAGRLLKPILDLPAGERDLLLDTLDTWVSSGGSTKQAASRLYCHPNTVRYRLQRVQTVLRVSVADPVQLTELVVALRAWRLFQGTRSLPPAT